MTIPGGQEPVDPVSGHRGKVDFTGVQWGSVEWTNLCTLYLRACESRLAQPVLGDHLAAQDVARIDYDFKRIHRRVHPWPISSGWHCVARNSIPGPRTT